MTEKEFNLSDKAQECFILGKTESYIEYSEKDVKEFIKRLKKQLKRHVCSKCVEMHIDALAGDKLK